MQFSCGSILFILMRNLIIKELIVIQQIIKINKYIAGLQGGSVRFGNSFLFLLVKVGFGLQAVFEKVAAEFFFRLLLMVGELV